MISFQDQPQQSHTVNMNTRTYNQSEPAVGRGKLICQYRWLFYGKSLVADYDPINDDRGSLARGYEPTSKAMHAASKTNRFKWKRIAFHGFSFRIWNQSSRCSSYEY